MTSTASDFDKLVGRIAGAIYGDLVTFFSEPPLMLIPPVTFKVRKVLEHFTNLRLLSDEQQRALADEIRVAIVPMLFSYEVDADQVERMAPIIETAVLKSLTQEAL